MVPDMFQVPISAPTASKMKIGVVIDESALRAAFAISSQEYPFLRRIRATTMALRINATCTGPSRASCPNKRTAPTIRTTSATDGMMASAYDGSLTLLRIGDALSMMWTFGQLAPEPL